MIWSELPFILYDIFLQHPYLYTILYLGTTYIVGITFYLWKLGKIEPVYKRKIPKSISDIKQELDIEWKTVKLIIYTSFGYPIVYYTLIAIACIPLAIIVFFVTIVGVISIPITPTMIILLLILFK